MELNPNNTAADAVAAAATSDAENETPPHPLSVKSKGFINGSFAHHHHHHHLHHHTPQPPLPPGFVFTFKECLKNHAASIGGHALDGCGEFMPSPDSTVTEPASLTCAACGCHRNFHRRDHDVPAPVSAHFLEFRRGSPSPSSSPPPPHVPPQMLLALRPTGPEDHPIAMNHHHHHNHHSHQYPHSVATPATPTAYKVENSSGRKRFRTKFSQDQKEKMLIFAEKLGWKMQRCDENLIEKFCSEIGISRGVLKVWLHNNKSTLGKRETKLISFHNNSNNNHNIGFRNQPQINEVSVVSGVNHLNLHNVSNTNAASSSDS